MSKVSVAALHVDPIKSARDLPSSSVRVAHFGFDDDRSRLLVDGSGGMVTQRRIGHIKGVIGRRAGRPHLDGRTVRFSSVPEKPFRGFGIVKSTRSAT